MTQLAGAVGEIRGLLPPQERGQERGYVSLGTGILVDPVRAPKSHKIAFPVSSLDPLLPPGAAQRGALRLSPQPAEFPPFPLILDERLPKTLALTFILSPGVPAACRAG